MNFLVAWPSLLHNYRFWQWSNCGTSLSSNSVSEVIPASHRLSPIELEDWALEVIQDLKRRWRQGAMLNPPCRFIGKSCCHLKGINWGMCPEVLHSVYWQMVRRFLDWTETNFLEIEFSVKHLIGGKTGTIYVMLKTQIIGLLLAIRGLEILDLQETWPCQCQKVCSEFTFHRKYQRYGLNINSVPRVSWR